MRTVTSKVHAYLMDHHNPEALFSDDLAEVVSEPFYTPIKRPRSGWTYVGEAEITLQIESKDQLVLNKIESLENEKIELMADSQRKLTRLDEQIQNLKAITLEPEITA